jgi:hypothetical protein
MNFVQSIEVKMAIKLVLFSLIFILILYKTYAVSVDVKISKKLNGNITSFNYEFNGNLAIFNIEFYNTGSVPYISMVRIDIFNNSQQIFTAWSNEKKLMAGDKKVFELYWFTNLTGNFSGRIRVYFANEILEKYFTFEKKLNSLYEKAFSISKLRTYEDFIVFDLKAEKDINKIIIIPEDIPLGWIFQQKKLESIKKGEYKTVAISYKPAVWHEENLTLSVSSLDGNYFAQEKFVLKKKSGILGFIYYLIDTVKLAISSN